MIEYIRKKPIFIISNLTKNRVIILIVFLCFLLSGCFFTRTNSKLTDYSKRRLSWDAWQRVMPDLNDLPDYINIFYQYRYKFLLIFVDESMILVVNYDDETYDSEISKLNDFNYLKEAVYCNNKNEYLLPEPEFKINSFNFRVLKEEHPGFPKYIGIIATSDERKSIAYLYYINTDRDLLSSNMVDFVEEYFRYDW